MLVNTFICYVHIWHGSACFLFGSSVCCAVRLKIECSFCEWQRQQKEPSFGLRMFSFLFFSSVFFAFWQMKWTLFPEYGHFDWSAIFISLQMVASMFVPHFSSFTRFYFCLSKTNLQPGVVLHTQIQFWQIKWQNIYCRVAKHHAVQNSV